MRRGAASTSRALEEQVTAGEQVSKEAERLVRQIAGVSRAVSEQAVAAAQITTATQSMRQQSDQVAKAMSEQTRAARDMTSAIQNVSKEVGHITFSNRQHLDSSEKVLGTLNDIRQISERNAQSVHATLSGTTDLNERARQLAEIMDSMSAGDASDGGGKRPSSTAARGSRKAGTASPTRNRRAAADEPQPSVNSQTPNANGDAAGEGGSE
jgi:methyl-accepting chemotaxis protein